MILRDGAVELLNVLLPHLAGVHVERVMASGRSVHLEAATCTAEAECSVCGQPSRRVHSRYRRWLDDREIGGRAVAIRLQVRRALSRWPLTIAAAGRFKRLAAKAGAEAADTFREVLISVLSETARRIIWQ